MHIRPATDIDRHAICAVHMDAFGQMQGPEIVELVDGLLGDETAKPLFSLVADNKGSIVGHILFTAVTIQPQNPAISAQILAPLGVAQAHQRQGVGTALVRAGLSQLAASGVGLVFVLGHPDYYPRFGFRPAEALGLDAPYPIPAAHQEAWMVQPLQAGIIGPVQGTVQCAETLAQPQHWQE